MAHQPVTLKHPKLESTYTAPSEAVADVLRKSGWKDATSPATTTTAPTPSPASPAQPTK